MFINNMNNKLFLSIFESKLLNISLLSVIEVEPHAHQPNILEYLQKKFTSDTTKEPYLCR